jgi:hypothetical protein
MKTKICTLSWAGDTKWETEIPVSLQKPYNRITFGLERCAISNLPTWDRRARLELELGVELTPDFGDSTPFTEILEYELRKFTAGLSDPEVVCTCHANLSQPYQQHLKISILFNLRTRQTFDVEAIGVIRKLWYTLGLSRRLIYHRLNDFTYSLRELFFYSADGIYLTQEGRLRRMAKIGAPLPSEYYDLKKANDWHRQP